MVWYRRVLREPKHKHTGEFLVLFLRPAGLGFGFGHSFPPHTPIIAASLFLANHVQVQLHRCSVFVTFFESF
jgi:hypothetical protein